VKKETLHFICMHQQNQLSNTWSWSKNAQCMETATVTQSQLWESENCADSF